MKLRHFVPLLFALSIIVGIIIWILNISILKYLFWFELLLYLIIDLIACFERVRKGILHIALMFIIYPLFHISYGIGSIAGIGKIIKKMIKK